MQSDSSLSSIAHLLVCGCILWHVTKSVVWKCYESDHVNVCQLISLRMYTVACIQNFTYRNQIPVVFTSLENSIFWSPFGSALMANLRRRVPTGFKLISLSTAPHYCHGFANRLPLYTR
ncbi:hypothetical protein PoB_003286400 [Plakobranchus ocellatus]|uniref:Secreted protein n=1 Tax=Plakobranchus ocellatus TaxID=259542 RepID=A0AAV4AJE4_9GAST|nr:hypothetical protein PoB_003286400 [Plakobranchus ocellatus]